MKEELIAQLFVISIFAIVALATTILLLVKTRESIALDRKFSKYTIVPLNNTTLSFFDKIENLFGKYIKSFSKRIEKMYFFKRYSEKYEKHISYEQRDRIEPIDFISVKLLFGFILLFLYIITHLIRSTSFTIFGILIVFIIGFFVLDIFVQINYSHKRKRIEEDLLKAIIIMNSSFSSGRSMVQAIEIVKDELEGPISDEFKKIYLDISYGLSLEVVFERFYNRVKLEDVKYITSSLTLLNKTGGNIVKVFEAIEREFFDKKKLTNELKMMTSSSMLVFKILLVLPFILYVVIFILNAEYFRPLFVTKIGIVMLSLMVMLYVIYILLVKKIMKVDV